MKINYLEIINNKITKIKHFKIVTQNSLFPIIMKCKKFNKKKICIQQIIINKFLKVKVNNKIYNIIINKFLFQTKIIPN